MPASSFEPVLLDLHEDDDYFVISSALDEFSARMDELASGEHELIARGGGNGFEERSFRILGARARRLRAMIEAQLDANAEARRATS